MDANLHGVISGFTLKTKPEQIYRALIEATAFGVRNIDTHEAGAQPLTALYACGGLTKDQLLMQIADVLGKPIKVAASLQPVALGAAIFGALAARCNIWRQPPLRCINPIITVADNIS
jgi:L-ribulokinase